MHSLRQELKKNESTLRESSPSSSNIQQEDVGIIQESDRNESSSETQQEEKVVEIKCVDVLGLASLPDGEHFVSGGKEGKIRRWRVKDGKEVGTPIDVGSTIWSIAVSQDGKWIVSGGKKVTVWDEETHEKVRELEGHAEVVCAVDISPDATKIAGESLNDTLSVWSLSTGERLLGPFKHDNDVDSVKFSPDGLLIATATADLAPDHHDSVRIYDSRDGHLLVNFPIQACWSNNHSLAWKTDSRHLFVLSRDGDIHCLNPYARTTLSKWRIHNNTNPHCISLASDGSFIAASDDSSVSFWDTNTYKQIGSLIHHPTRVHRMAISANYDLVTSGGSKVILRNLQNVLPSPYCISESWLKKAEPHRLREKIRSSRREHERSLQEIWKANDLLDAYRQTHQCEALSAAGHIMDASHKLLEIMRAASDDVKADTVIMDWLFEITKKCITVLGPSTPTALLIRWASIMLLRGSIKDALDVSTVLKIPRFLAYQVICDVLEGDGRLTEAINCFRKMRRALAPEVTPDRERVQWEISFQRRCMKTLGSFADVAIGAQNYKEGVKHLSTILSLNPADRADTLIKRSKVNLMMKSWNEALEDADEVIKLEPSSHRGYEQRHTALHGAKRYSEAVEAFDTMLSKLEHSSDPSVRKLRARYFDSRPTVRRIVNATLSRMPRVLIDTDAGRLRDRAQLAEVFEEHPLFMELISSSTTREVDCGHVQDQVQKFYEYVMFSHKWEKGEPLLQDVEHISVYDLKPSRANKKLQTFCSTVRSLGYRWAWSDTCCVDKVNKVVLEESLVAMFNWYRGSALTLVHLLDVLSHSNEIGIKESVWNTRAWTYQEYLAAKKVLFYTQDWKPYLGLTLSNHKESKTIISEMEMDSQNSTRQSRSLQPGFNRVREKLYLASTRQATFEEDLAYSLFGIFNVAIPVIYGEGNRAVGRLLEHILTGSGDVTILAWTGSTTNEYNSCLPTDLTVYNELVPPHLPPSMETAEVDQIVAELHSSISDLSAVLRLYDQLNALPSPSLASSRLRLPAILFHVNKAVRVSGPDPKTKTCVYCATTTMFGEVEINTMSDLTTMDDLCLVHPWIRPLLDQEYRRGSIKLDRTTRALQLVARLTQQFGALLFEQVSRVEYQRVAPDSFIMVQFRKDVSLDLLMENINTIDVQ